MHGRKYFFSWTNHLKTGPKVWNEGDIYEESWLWYESDVWNWKLHLYGDARTWEGNNLFVGLEKIAKLGVRSDIGDDVLVYWKSTTYALRGKHVSNNGSMIEVKLNLIRRRTYRLITSELELLDKVLVRVLGHTTALIGVKEHVVNVEGSSYK